MANSGGFGNRPGQTERSSSGVLEDIKKLLLIALFSGPVAFAGCGLLYLVFWIVWSHFEPRRASQWFKTWADVLCIVPLILWALAFFVLLAAWLVEMWNKHWPPAYGPAQPPQLGRGVRLLIRWTEIPVGFGAASARDPHQLAPISCRIGSANSPAPR